MKVMHLLQSAHFSGAENVVCQIISMFRNTNVEMIYVSRTGSIESALEERGIDYYLLDRLDLKSVRDAIKRIRPDIVHAHDVSASIIAAIASMGMDCRVISHMHVNNDDMRRLNFKTVLYAFSSIRYSHIFWVSSSCYENYRFKALLHKRSSVLCNVMIRDDILQKRDSDPQKYNYDIVYVGRLSYQKNPQRLLKIILGVKKLFPNLKVAIVGGNGELVEKTADAIGRMGLYNTIDMVGFMSNPLKIMSDSKVMLMTSRYEGLPMCVLEAMALGVPVVSTPVDGLVDVIKNDVNGFLSESDEELIKNVLYIIKNSDARNRLSNNTISIFEKINDIGKYKLAILNAYNR